MAKCRKTNPDKTLVLNDDCCVPRPWGDRLRGGGVMITNSTPYSIPRRDSLQRVAASKIFSSFGFLLVVVLGDLAGDLDDGRLLEAVRADHGAGHLPGDGHHGHAVQHGVRQPGHQVGGAGARGGDAHRRPARHLRVPLRGKNLALRAQTTQSINQSLPCQCQASINKHHMGSGSHRHYRVVSVLDTIGLR
eukprot:1195139-Prorocentrum_minimum.AAC.5